MTVNKMRRLVIALSVMVLIFVVSVADATTVDFEIGTGNYIDYNTTELGISHYIYDPPAGIYSLNEGDSWTFDYAKIFEVTVKETASSYGITAYLDFVLPDDVGVVGSGGTVTTVKITGHGKCKKGMCGSTDTFDIVFDPPTIVYFGYANTGEFIVNISDLNGLSWDGGKCCYKPAGTGILTAEVTLVSAPAAAVPEPSTLLLLGSGLLGIAAFRMRRGRRS